jgi:hypothetical protein
MFCLFNTGMTSEVRSIILKGFGRHSIDDIHRCVSDLVKGKRKTCKGWSMECLQNLIQAVELE